MSAYAAYLTGCKISVYFYQIFSTFFQLISKHGKELTVSVILYPFSEMQASGCFRCHRQEKQPQTIFAILRWA